MFFLEGITDLVLIIASTLAYWAVPIALILLGIGFFS